MRSRAQSSPIERLHNVPGQKANEGLESLTLSVGQRPSDDDIRSTDAELTGTLVDPSPPAETAVEGSIEMQDLGLKERGGRLSQQSSKSKTHPP